MATKEKSLDLRPGFVKNGDLFAKREDSGGDAASAEVGKKEYSGFGTEYARELSLTESKVFDVFDALARRIDNHLDYPDILIEEGVQGRETLDLYFDHEGWVDESKSRIAGDSQVLRGVLAHAARLGIAEWLNAEWDRLRLDQFRDQHFHADFVLNELTSTLSGVQKDAVGTYGLFRRKGCLRPGDARMDVDLGCLSRKAVGSLKDLVSPSRRQAFENLKDRLRDYDDLGLQGINEQARRG